MNENEFNERYEIVRNLQHQLDGVHITFHFEVIERLLPQNRTPLSVRLEINDSLRDFILLEGNNAYNQEIESIINDHAYNHFGVNY